MLFLNILIVYHLPESIPMSDRFLPHNYSNPKWFVEGHPDGVSFHKPKKSTNDIGLLYINTVSE
ncbi:hypothetical protein [Pseudanabaena sp. SR411]|uniref:hypothetical protein n=1 Tax=Pseudanabaena sp. SR411 TaxID=1980935 RepID=UPI00113FE792|nr:hypothetical protein [Pseudanabaena sp. SR411]